MADSIRVSTENLEAIQAKLRQLQMELNQKSNDIRALVGRLDDVSGADVRVRVSMRLANGGSISGSNAQDVLSSLNRSLKACGNEVKRVHGAISSVERLFRDNEHKLSLSFRGQAMGSGAEFGGASGAPGGAGGVGPVVPAKGSDAPIDWRWKDLVVKLVESAGMGGGLISSLIEIGSVPGLAKFLVKSADSIAEWKGIVKESSGMQAIGTSNAIKTYGKKIFGLESYASSVGLSATSSAASVFKAGFKKGIASPAAWVTEAIDRGVENYAEYTGGYKDAPTAIAEWVCETGVGVVATTAAVAAAGALIGGPAILAAAVGGLVVWGVDTLWANTIGRGKDEDGGNEGLIEMAGEGIVELGKQAISGVSWLAEKTGALCRNMKSIHAAWAY